MGDAVNLAARLEHTAVPGILQISEETYHRVATVFDVEPLGEIEVKGRPRPIRAYRVIRERAGVALERGIQGLEAPLVGRDHALSRRRESLADLRRGRGQIVSVMGAAGIGKSRLLDEARTEALREGARRGPGSGDEKRTGHARPETSGRAPSARQDPEPMRLRWHQGRSFSYQTVTPYAPMIDVLRDMLALDAAADAGAAYECVKTGIASVLPSRADAHAPFLAWLLGIEEQAVERRVRYLEPPGAPAPYVRSDPGGRSALGTRST